MISESQHAFLSARSALPLAPDSAKQVIVIKTGRTPGLWTPHFVPLSDESRYFIFIRDAGRARWICTDKHLQDWLDLSNIFAFKTA